MARKVFMSVLGTGFYEKCIYKGSKSSVQTRFVQEAVLEDIGAKDWTKEDVAYIMLTSKARTDNWDETKTTRYNIKSKCDEHYERLEKVLNGAELPCQVQAVDISDGRNEDEMWQVFTTIFDLLQEEDELYFDLTHAFRYLPMLLLVLGNYAKFLKNVRVVYMSYGNWEGRKQDEANHDNDLAPIIDLLPLSILEDWTFAAGAFRKTGRVEPLLSSLNVENLRNDFNGTVKIFLNDLIKSLQCFEKSVRVCQSKEIIEGGDACMVKGLIRKLVSKEMLPAPLSSVLNDVKSDFMPYSQQEASRNITCILQWCKKYGLVQQGYTLCQEGIVTLFVERYKSLVTFPKQKEYRNYWSAILGIEKAKVSDPDCWRDGLLQYKEISKAVFATAFVRNVREIYADMTNKRNAVNHAGYSGNVSLDKIFDEFNEIIDRCIAEIFNADFPEIIVEWETASSEETHSIFINYSNHPSSCWSQKQLSAAREFGRIEDIPFRSVAPEADSAELERIASVELTKILDAAAGKNAVVHIMGEMTLTYILVRKLKASGIRCVASTTARSVVENADGTRTSDFDFVRFRDYE